MRTKHDWAPGTAIRVISAKRNSNQWRITAIGQKSGVCPGCGDESASRHSWYSRGFQDLPSQGTAVTLKVRMSRWRCGNAECKKLTFSEQIPDIAASLARRTHRVTELMRTIGHSTGGRPGERLMERLGVPTSDDTIVRHLKRHAAARQAPTVVRVAGVDDWSWRKGCRYGTIVVDLEQREVADVLADRSAAGTADWLSRHPEVEIVSRDRCGLYAQGAREGAPQAKQVADRFHLIQNLRETIQAQLSRADRYTGRPMLSPVSGVDDGEIPISKGPYGEAEVAEHRHRVMEAYRQSRRTLFERIKTLQAAGETVHDIARKTGFNWRTISKWLRCWCMDRSADAVLLA